MTDEDSFQAAIDANPKDQTARCVLADYLLENSDPRGPGYCALARLGRQPCMRENKPGYHVGKGLTTYSMVEVYAVYKLNRQFCSLTEQQKHVAVNESAKTITMKTDPIHSLPRVWFNACWNKWWDSSDEQLPWILMKTRRELDNWVAKAFLNTPANFRDHVLNCPLPVAFPFRFPCQNCDGFGGTHWSSEDGGSPYIQCFVCKGKGHFVEVYGGG